MNYQREKTLSCIKYSPSDSHLKLTDCVAPETPQIILHLNLFKPEEMNYVPVV